MAFYLAQATGLMNGAFPWSCNSVLQSSGSEAAVATAFNAAWVALFTQAALVAFLPTDLTLTQTSVSTASSTFKQTTKTVTAAAHAGTSASPGLPYHTCEIITFRTAQAARYGRGRWYFPPMASNALAANGFQLIAAAQTALQSGMNAYATSRGSAYSHVILHRSGAGFGQRTANSTDTVTGADIPSTFAIQKRRADKVVPSRLTVAF